MICDICKKREASIFIKKIVDGRKVEHSLCEVCASEAMISAGDISEFKENIIHSLSDMLAGFSDAQADGVKSSKTCPQCGATFLNFQQTGRLGCASCYDTFKKEIAPLLKRLQGAVQHAGKTPPGREKEAEIGGLRKELQELIAKEEYERAAVIRDRIKELELDKENRE